MFGKDKGNVNTESPEWHIPILTIDHFPGRNFDVVDLIAVSLEEKKGISDLLDRVKTEIQNVAVAQGCDAVIGVRFEGLRVVAGSTSTRLTVVGYGTAIKLK